MKRKLVLYSAVNHSQWKRNTFGEIREPDGLCKFTDVQINMMINKAAHFQTAKHLNFAKTEIPSNLEHLVDLRFQVHSLRFVY